MMIYSLNRYNIIDYRGCDYVIHDNTLIECSSMITLLNQFNSGLMTKSHHLVIDLASINEKIDVFKIQHQIEYNKMFGRTTLSIYIEVSDECFNTLIRFPLMFYGVQVNIGYHIFQPNVQLIHYVSIIGITIAK